MNRKQTWKRHRLKFVDIALYFHPLQWKVVTFLQRFVISMINVLQNLYSQYCFGLSALRLYMIIQFTVLTKEMWQETFKLCSVKNVFIAQCHNNLRYWAALISIVFLSLKRKKKRNIW